MRRVVCIVVVYLMAMGGAATLLVWRFGADAEKVGRILYGHRFAVRKMLEPSPLTRPRVVWLGDSTLISRFNYSALVVHDMPAVEHRVAAMAGFGPYAYYFVMDRVLALHPSLIVLVANFRVMPARPVRTDLCSMLPLAELPRTLFLPLHAGGLSVPGLGLT